MTTLEPLFGRIDEHDAGASRRDVVRILFKHRWLIALCVCAASAVTVFGVSLLPPTYKATAKVLVQTEQQATPTFFAGLAAYTERRDFDPAGRRLETEMGLIEAAPISDQVVRELGLTWRDIYHAPLEHLAGAAFDRVGPWLRQIAGVTMGSPSHNETVAEFQRSLTVGPSESKSAETTSNIISLELKAPKAEVARTALARVVDLYLDWDRRLSHEAGAKALDLVTRELTTAAQEVTHSENEMRQFLAAAGFDPARSESTRHVAQETGAGLITSPGDDQTIAQLKAARVQLEVELTRAREIYLPTSETVRSLTRAADQLRARVTDEVSRNADNYARFNSLDRQLRTAEARFNELRRREAEISLFVQINERPTASRIVVEPPLLPEKSDWPRRAVIAASGPIAGLVLALGLVGLSGYTDSTLRSKQQVRRRLGIDVLAVIPKATARELRALRAQPQAMLTPGTRLGLRWGPTFQALAQRVAREAETDRPQSDARTGRSVLVTSPRSREGKTFTAGLLAHGLSELGFGTVLLVDADINSTRSARDGRPAPWNLTHLPTIEMGTEVHADEASQAALTVLAADDSTAVAGDATGARLQRFLERERQRFDWIIFDGGSVGRGGVNALAREVDAVLLVVAAEETRLHVVQDALESLPVTDREKVRVVLNRSRYHIPRFLYDEV